MARRLAVAVALTLCLTLPGSAAAAPPGPFTPGSAGLGDPYFPLDGNGGYDVQHYDLKLTYDPATDKLIGEATITAVATQNLSAFDFDFVGLRLRSVTVDGVRATTLRKGQELTVTPRSGLVNGSTFTVVANYDGVPPTLPDFGRSGFIHTDDGAIVVGEPHVASSWFPANDHPRDRASFTIHITVPAGLEAISNGVLTGHETNGAWATSHWDAVEPMATYLAFMAIGEFEVRDYQAAGIEYWDAIDSRFFEDEAPAVSPISGAQFLYSQMSDMSWKRLTRTIDVPAGGAQLSFLVHRETEPGWDFLFVEARTAGGVDWTTLPDANGHTSQDTGECPYNYWDLHPFLEHYVTPFVADPGDPSTPDDDFYRCNPTGTTGTWNAASGSSGGWETWSVQLPNAGATTKQLEVSISYASDWSVQLQGVEIDDIVVSTGQGSTGFENDGNAMDGWVAPIAGPEGSPDNENTWVVTDLVAAIPGPGQSMFNILDLQPEILAFEVDNFGPYPFSASGAVIDEAGVGFALENQTRPTYAPFFFFFDDQGFVIVHELAHQWYGDEVAVDSWNETWLNEGFATYAEWLWSDERGFETPQQIFEDFATIPADDGFWDLAIGDPGIDCMFCGEVYARGALTLQALRNEVGSVKFFRILKAWVQQQGGGTGTTREFIDLAESIYNKDLDPLFAQWLGSGKPTIGMPNPPGPNAAPTLRSMSLAIQSLNQRIESWKANPFGDGKTFR